MLMSAITIGSLLDIYPVRITINQLELMDSRTKSAIDLTAYFLSLLK